MAGEEYNSDDGQTITQINANKFGSVKSFFDWLIDFLGNLPLLIGSFVEDLFSWGDEFSTPFQAIKDRILNGWSKIFGGSDP